MPDVRVTVDGKTVSVPSTGTVLDAARVAGVDIPTLCHHVSIEPIGACRMCLVEIEKVRGMHPACTYPVSEGMVVQTETPKLVEARRFVLQLLFSERNHYCMFCQMSGSCELQNLAYRYGLDHWLYERAYPKLPVDATREYFVMDQNRCILCRRCVRACSEVVGNNTLGLKHRGAQTMIIADMDVPFGKSSCVSCGTCLQVCPTGALGDRASAYMGATKDVQRVKSTCTGCSVGCGTELVVRGNRVIRVEGDWAAAPSQGLLCVLGRFAPFHEKRARVTKPLVKKQGQWAEATWEEALGLVAAKLRAAGTRAGALVAGDATTEAGQALVAGLPGQKALLEGGLAEAAPCFYALDEADLYLVAQTDLTVEHQVVGLAIKRNTNERGARLVILDDQDNGLSLWSHQQWTPAQADKVIALAQGAQNPLIIYGPRGAALAATLAKALPQATRMPLSPSSNALGLTGVGVKVTAALDGAPALYVLAGETAQLSAAALATLKKAGFVAVQAAFREPWAEVADVILPSPVAFEKSGTVTNMEGGVKQVVAAVKTKLPSEVDVITSLAKLI
jgi:formate dehydrogenase major subunit